VRRLLDTIMLDSMNHLEICRTAVEVIEGENLDLDERLELKVGLQKQIEFEIASLERAEQLLENPVVESNEDLRVRSQRKVAARIFPKRILGCTFFR